MRIHWYWPFARPEELPLARCTASQGDDLRIDVIDRNGAPIQTREISIEVVRSLPDVDRNGKSHISWMLSRSRTYVKRALRRRVTWRDNRFDIAHIHYLNRFTDLWFGRHRPQVVVISVHDVVPHQRRGPAHVEDWILRKIYNNADALVVHHQTLRDDLCRRFDIAEQQIYVVEHQVFPVAPEERSVTPEHAIPTVLFFGSLRANKGLEILVETIRNTPSVDNVRFQFAGHGDPDLEELLTHLAATDNRVSVEIDFVSYERKCQLFRESTVVVLPYTEFSSQSGVLHDAYGHGRPVVVSDVGALGATVRKDQTGLVVHAADSFALSAALTQVLNGEVDVESMRNRALQIADERSPQNLGPQLRAIYKSLLRRS